jgi:hypothetical protein
MNLIFGIIGYYTTYKNSPNLKQTVFEELGLKTMLKQADLRSNLECSLVGISISNKLI